MSEASRRIADLMGAGPAKAFITVSLASIGFYTGSGNTYKHEALVQAYRQGWDDALHSAARAADDV